MTEKVNITDILYADYDLNDETKMFVYIPETKHIHYFIGSYNENSKPEIIEDPKTKKKYLVKFDI